MSERMATAIVGLGWWGRHMIGSLADSAKISVVRAVDVRRDAAGELLEQHGISFSTDLNEVLADDAIDAVILTTPHSLHEQQVLAVAAAGKHCFCEKPMTLTSSSARRVVEACADAGIQLGIGHARQHISRRQKSIAFTQGGLFVHLVVVSVAMGIGDAVTLKENRASGRN